MKKGELSRDRIIEIVRAWERGDHATAQDACRAVGVSRQAFYNWRVKYGSKPDDSARIASLERETAQLRRIIARQAAIVETLLRHPALRSSFEANPLDAVPASLRRNGSAN